MLHLDLILKNNELCLVGQARGRIRAQEAGLYVRDTRFLSRCDITCAGEELRALDVHTVSGDHVVIFATNGPRRQGESSIVADTLAIRIDLRLGTSVQIDVSVENFGRDTVKGDLEFRLEADFKDMFAVRGWTPRRPPAVEPLQIDDGSATLSARNADGSLVSTRIKAPHALFEAPESDTGVIARIPLTLPSGESHNSSVEIAPQPLGEPLRAAGSFSAEEGFTPRLSLSTPSADVDAFIRQCDADLALLQTTFPDGNIPAAGIPWYVAPFGRDSLIVALQTMHLYPERSDHTLRVLAALQGEKHDPFTEEAPGKILHEMRYGHMARDRDIPHTPYYGSVDATPLFVMTFARHYLWHRDDALYNALIDIVRRAFAWIETDGDLDGDGFIEYSGEKLEQAHLPQQGWKDSEDSLNFADGRPAQGPIALVEAQGYVYAAYAWMSKVARLRGDEAWASELHDKAENIRQRVEDAFWMEDAGFYAQALDGEKKPVNAISSNPGHLLYCGLPEYDRADAVAQRLAEPDMSCGWGIRTLSSQMASYNPMSYHNGSIWPHDNSLIIAGLRAYGHDDLACELAQVLMSLAQPDPELRIAELYCGFGRDTSPNAPVNYPRTCLPQAWAAGAGVLAATTLLGVDLDPDGNPISTPHLPEDWDRMEAHGFRAGTRTFGVHGLRSGDGWRGVIIES